MKKTIYDGHGEKLGYIRIEYASSDTMVYNSGIAQVSVANSIMKMSNNLWELYRSLILYWRRIIWVLNRTFDSYVALVNRAIEESC